MGPSTSSVLLAPIARLLVPIVIAISIVGFTAARFGRLDKIALAEFSDDKVINSGETSVEHHEDNRLGHPYRDDSGRSSEDIEKDATIKVSDNKVINTDETFVEQKENNKSGHSYRDNAGRRSEGVDKDVVTEFSANDNKALHSDQTMVEQNKNNKLGHPYRDNSGRRSEDLDNDIAVKFSDENVQNSNETSAVHADNLGHSFRDNSGKNSEIRIRTKRGMFAWHYNITAMMANPRTIEYLNSLQNLIQRQLIAQHLSTCPWVPLCRFSLPIHESFADGFSCCQKCDCVKHCSAARRCCPDYKLLRANDTVTRVESSGKVTPKCRLPALKQTTKNDEYMIIDYCPENSHEKLKKNCTRPYKIGNLTLYDVTVVTDMNTRYAYRNRHCARCNGGMNIRHWNMQVNCAVKMEKFSSGNDLINKILSKSTCALLFRPEPYYGAKHCPSIISECNVTGFWTEYDSIVELGCWQHDLPLKFDGQRYRNVMCAVCNGMGKGLHLPSGNFCGGGKTEAGVPTFSGLITFTNLETEEKQIVNTICQDGYIYDHKSKSCRQLYCSDLHYLINNKCVRVFERVQSLALCVSYNLIPLQPTSMNTLPDLLPVLDRMLRRRLRTRVVTTICDVKLFIKTAFQYGRPIHEDALRYNLQNWTSIRTYITIEADHIHRPVDPEGIIEELISLTNIDAADDEKGMVYRFRVETADCYHDDRTEIPREILRVGVTEEFLSPEFIANVAIADAQDNALIIPFATGISQCTRRSYFYPYNSFLSCPMVKVTYSDIPGIVKSNTLWIPKTNMTVGYEQFYKDYDRKSIYICADLFLSMPVNGFCLMTPTLMIIVVYSSVSPLFGLLFL